MTVNIGQLNAPKAYNYRYDQLNRLSSMNVYGGLNQSTNSWIGSNTTSANYQEAVTYDPNGNIKTYLRNGTTDGGGNLAMDNLTYQYEKNSAGQLISNRLRYVHDQVADANYTNDLDNQTTKTLAQVQTDNAANSTADNYYYDPIGNPYTDRKAEVNNMVWNVYGKLSLVYKNVGPANASYYFYDAAGNRNSKVVDKYSDNTEVATYYVRDAAGNVMSVYTHGTSNLNSGHMTQTEIHLYGSSRLGVLNTNLDVQTVVSPANTNFTRGNKFFELTNHLGNVLATVSDKKIPVSANSSTIDYYTADVITANDYYPFGMQMPNRTFAQTNSNYRYGFNGKENDNEVKGNGNEQDYGMRIYDTRIGRFLSVDPITAKYPELTPYQFASNRTIDGIDRDGLEYCPTIPTYQTDAGNGWDYVAAIDNGLIDVLNLVPQLWNSGVSTVQNVRKGTYWRTVGAEFKATGSQLKDVGIKVWHQPLKTLTSPDAVEFLVSGYIGGKIIPVGGGTKGNLLKPATAIKNVTTAATEATEEKVLLKEYGGPGGGHHVPAKSAFVGAVGYDLNKALAIPNAELARLGIDHGLVTGAQMKAYKAFASAGATLTWEAMSTIETNALIKGSLNAAAAKRVVTEAIDDLKKAGVTAPTRIPWGGK